MKASNSFRTTSRPAPELIAILLVLAGIIPIYFDLKLAVMFALGLLALPLVAREPIFAFYVSTPVLILFRNLEVSIPFPIFSSPVDLLVTIGVGLGVIGLVVRRVSLPRSPIYFPIGMFVVVAVVQTLIVHSGNALHEVALGKVIRGMWPFGLIVLGLRTPRQARYLLIVLFGTIFVALLVWLPGFAYAAVTNNLILIRTENFTAIGTPVVDWSLRWGLRTYLFVVPVATLVSFPLAYIALVPRYRIFSVGLLITVAIFTLFSSIASSVVSLMISALITFGLLFISQLEMQGARARRHVSSNLIWSIITGLIFFFLLQAIFTNVPYASQTLKRIQNPADDVSGATRLELLRQTTRTFLSDPIFGNNSGEGIWHGGHDSLITYAANWGLLFSVPYLLALTTGVFILLYLLHLRKNKAEKALLIGIIACIIANILSSITTPNILELFADMLNWTFIGLAVVWHSWIKENPDTALY